MEFFVVVLIILPSLCNKIKDLKECKEYENLEHMLTNPQNNLNNYKMSCYFCQYIFNMSFQYPLFMGVVIRNYSNYEYNKECVEYENINNLTQHEWKPTFRYTIEELQKYKTHEKMKSEICHQNSILSEDYRRYCIIMTFTMKIDEIYNLSSYHKTGSKNLIHVLTFGQYYIFGNYINKTHIAIDLVGNIIKNYNEGLLINFIIFYDEFRNHLFSMTPSATIIYESKQIHIPDLKYLCEPGCEDPQPLLIRLFDIKNNLLVVKAEKNEIFERRLTYDEFNFIFYTYIEMTHFSQFTITKYMDNDDVKFHNYQGIETHNDAISTLCGKKCFLITITLLSDYTYQYFITNRMRYFKQFTDIVYNTELKYGIHPKQFTDDKMNVTLIIKCEHKRSHPCLIHEECITDQIRYTMNFGGVNFYVREVNPKLITDRIDCLFANFERKRLPLDIFYAIFDHDDTSEAFQISNKTAEDLNKWIENHIKYSMQVPDVNMDANKMISVIDTILLKVNVNTSGDFTMFTLSTIEKKDSNITYNFTDNNTLPISLKMSWSGANDGFVTVAVLKNLTSFNMTDQFKSPVVIVHDINYSLSGDFEIHFTFMVKLYNSSEGEMGCYHQNKTNLKWENTHCKVVNVTRNSNNITISCTCNHLTSFAVLFNPYKTADDSMIMTQISVILSCISLLLSIVSLIIYLRLWVMKKSKPIIIIKCSVCLSLAILYSIYIVTQTFIGIQLPCQFNGILNHYTAMSYYLNIFFLSAVILLMILKPFYKLKLKVLLLLLIISYFLPASLSITFGIFLHEFYQTCSVQGILKHTSISMLGALLIILNIYSVIHLYAFSVKKIAMSVQNKIARNLKITFTLSIFLAIPLILQYMLINKFKPAIEYISNIFNLIQGIVILILVIATEITWFRRKEYNIRKSNDSNLTSFKFTLRLAPEENKL